MTGLNVLIQVVFCLLLKLNVPIVQSFFHDGKVTAEQLNRFQQTHSLRLGLLQTVNESYVAYAQPSIELTSCF